MTERGDLEPADQARLLAAKEDANLTAANYRAVAVEMMHKSSVRAVARITGLSTNTLQRWKREA